jgi:uncharacterized protein (TIGR02217 family)
VTLRSPLVSIEAARGGAPNVHAPLVAGEALRLGAPDVRAPLVAGESLITGLPNIRSALIAGESLISGLPHVRSPVFAVEVLSLVPPEPAVVNTAIFPQLTRGWSVIRKPTIAGRISTHQTGREIRQAQMQYPVREFTLTYEVLRSAPAYAELQTIEGFLLSQLGTYGQFLWQDNCTPDYQVTGGAIGTGDGTTLAFTLTRNWGGFAEPVGYVFPTGLTAVYFNGVVQSASSYSVGSPNQLVFATAPAAGINITADFTFYFQVRFSTDNMELEEFMSMLFELKELKLMQILPS